MKVQYIIGKAVETRRLEHPKEYQKWYDSHKAHCYKNFSGSSQSMEPEAAMTIWKRSTENRQLCYTTFIGDGDSKSYQQISKMKPSGSLLIHKEECLAHVSKRLKKNLCKIKKSTKNISTCNTSYPSRKPSTSPPTSLRSFCRIKVSHQRPYPIDWTSFFPTHKW